MNTKRRYYRFDLQEWFMTRGCFMGSRHWLNYEQPKPVDRSGTRPGMNWFPGNVKW